MEKAFPGVPGRIHIPVPGNGLLALLSYCRLTRPSKGYAIPIEELLPLDDKDNEDKPLDFDAITHNLQKLRPEDRDVIFYLIKRLAQS